MSAVRNLNGVDVGGRPLRIDLAESDPHLEGKTTVRGEIYPEAPPSSGWRGGGGGGGGRGFDPEAFLANLPPGVQIPKGSSSLDHISQTLATMQPSQLMEVLAQMKVQRLVSTTYLVTPDVRVGLRYYTPRSSKSLACETPTVRLRALSGAPVK